MCRMILYLNAMTHITCIKGLTLADLAVTLMPWATKTLVRASGLGVQVATNLVQMYKKMMS